MLLYYGFGKYAPVAQPVEHLTFNQGVRDSNSRRSTKKETPDRVSLFWFPCYSNRARSKSEWDSCLTPTVSPSETSYSPYKLSLRIRSSFPRRIFPQEPHPRGVSFFGFPCYSNRARSKSEWDSCLTPTVSPRETTDSPTRLSLRLSSSFPVARPKSSSSVC